MQTLQLIRITGQDGLKDSFGVLLLKGIPFLVTVELPWRNNENGRSCIPPGKYVVRPYKSPTKGEVWIIEDENKIGKCICGGKRSMVYFHSANRASQLLGCIAPGTSFGEFNDPSVESSKPGMAELRRVMGYTDSFILLIS